MIKRNLNMKKALLLLFFLAVAADLTLALDVTTFFASSIDASTGEATLYQHRSILFGLSCMSGPIGDIKGLKRISLGDTIRYKETSFKVGIIEVTRFNEDYISHGEKIAKKGDVVCVLVANEDAFPSDNDCDALWVRIVNCHPLKKRN